MRMERVEPRTGGVSSNEIGVFSTGVAGLCWELKREFEMDACNLRS